MTDVGTLTHSQFVENLNTNFRVHVDESTIVDLELIEVTDLDETPRQERFSLTFRGPLDFCLPQQLYQIDHDRIGSADLFLVPFAQEPDGYRYEMVFNRVKDRA